MEGFDTGWVDAGTRRQAFYTNLPPGDYRFRVRASNDGVPSEREAVWAFTLAPAFYQTRWFAAADGRRGAEPRGARVARPCAAGTRAVLGHPGGTHPRGTRDTRHAASKPARCDVSVGRGLERDRRVERIGESAARSPCAIRSSSTCARRAIRSETSAHRFCSPEDSPRRCGRWGEPDRGAIDRLSAGRARARLARTCSASTSICCASVKRR
jgi:hypothetical protein